MWLVYLVSSTEGVWFTSLKTLIQGIYTNSYVTRLLRHHHHAKEWVCPPPRRSCPKPWTPLVPTPLVIYHEAVRKGMFRVVLNECGTTSSLSWIWYSSPSVPNPLKTFVNRSWVAVIVVVIESTVDSWWRKIPKDCSLGLISYNKITLLPDHVAYVTILTNCSSTIRDWPAGVCRDLHALQ